MPLPDANRRSPRVYTNLQNIDLDTVTFANIQNTGNPIAIEEMNEDEMRRLVMVNLARLVCKGEWTGLLESGGGAETLGDLTDVLMDATNFTDSLLIQPNSDGSAPTTGTLNNAENVVGIGASALEALTQADYVIAIGTAAGKAITNGAGGVFIGGEACEGGNPSGAVMIGRSAGKTGSGNNTIAIGQNACRNASGANFNCVFIGNEAGYGSASYYNTGIGYEALADSNFDGHGNIAIGYQSGKTLEGGDDNVMIGSAEVADVDADDQLVISNGQTGDVSWIVGDDTGACFQGDNDASWSTTSDKRLKREIKDATKGLDAINAIQVRNFRYRKDNRYGMDPRPSRVGVIAQELEQVFPEAVKENAHGHKTVSTDSINWALLKAVQELSAKVEALEE